MLPLKGTWKDSPLSKQPNGYDYELVNATVSKNLGAITNENGSQEHSSSYNVLGYSQLGLFNAKNGIKIIFSKVSANMDAIGTIDANGVYVEKLQADLGFNLNYPIDCESYYNYKGELVVAFTDGYNTPKLINLDDITLPFNLNDIQLSSSFIQPKVVADVLEIGGSLLTGAYFPFFAYSKEDSRTPYTLIENPIFITTSTRGQSSYYEGSPPNVISPKSILLNIDNVDTTFTKIILGMLIRIDGVLTAKIIKEVPISSSSMSITYLGSEQLEEIDLASVLTPFVNYNKIKHITQVEGVLYGAGVTEKQPLDFQKYANLIKLKYTSTLKDFNNLEETYKFNAQNNRMKSFKHEEVYAMYIRVKIKGEGFSQAFHIPGRAAEGIETSLYSSLSGSLYNVQKSVSPTAKYYQIDDTSDVNGKFGFWENENEVYPNKPEFGPVNGSEDLRGKKVRHHRFPSIKKLKENTYTATTGYGLYKLDILGIEVASFPTLPADLASEIEGYEIFYAKRNTTNSLVSGQSIITFMATGRGDARYFSMGASADVNERFPNDSQEVAWQMKQDRLSFNSFDLMLDKLAINPTYISTQVGMRVNNINTNHTIAFDRGDTPGDRLYAWHVDYMNPTDAQDIGVPVGHAFKRINSFKYIPSRSNVDDYVNIMGMETAVAKLTDGGYPNIDFRSLYLYFGNANNSENNYSSEKTYLVNLMSYRTDVYNSVASQLLVSTGKFIKIGDTDKKAYGGDIFIGSHSFISTGLSDYSRYEIDSPNDYLNTPQRTLKTVRNYLLEGYNNSSLRHSVAGDDATKYVPKELLNGSNTWFLNLSINNTNNKIGYNKDYSSLNDLNASVIFDPDKEFVAEDPYKIIRSKIPNKEERVSSWKVFLANDYYIIPRNKGYITNIQGAGSDLFINCEQALLKTRGSEELATDTFKVVLGTGNIFDRAPVELIFEEEGYAGCQHKFSCLLTRYGYFFLDEDRKKVFLVNNTVVDVTEGLQDFFRENLNTTGDNPYREKGYTVGWDEEYQRITLSSLEAQFTRHYYPELKYWRGRSDYYPEMLLGNRNNSLFAIKNKKIHKLNAQGVKGQWFGEETVHPFIVVFIARDEEKQLTLNNIQWRTLVTLAENPKADITFTSISVWNSYQATGEISIIPHDSTKSLLYNKETANARRIKNIWNFNKLKSALVTRGVKFIDDIDIVPNSIDNSQPFYMKKPLSDDYIAIKLLFSNEKISNLQGDIQLLDFDINGTILNR